MASVTTSGPIPSPPMMPILCVTLLPLLLILILILVPATKNRPPEWTVESERR
jgi:hypothetical protein